MTKVELALFAYIMKRDLEENKLSVVLIPAPDQKFTGHMIRRAETQNPIWYKSLCNDFISERKGGPPRTYIKRGHVLRALDNLIKGKTGSVYAQRLIPHIKSFSQIGE